MPKLKYDLLPVPLLIKKNQMVKAKSLLFNLIFGSLLVGYYLTGSIWMLNMFTFVTAIGCIVLLLLSILCFTVLRRMFKQANSPNLQIEEKEKLYVELYLFTRNLYLTSTHGFALYMISLIITIAEICYLLILGHMFVPFMLVVSIAIGFTFRTIGKKFSIDEDLEQHIDKENIIFQGQ